MWQRLYLSDRILLSQGLLSRCLITAPESMSGQRFWCEPTESADVDIKRYGGRILGLLERPLPLAEGKANELTPRVLHLALDARKIWVEFADSIERQISPQGPLSPVKGIANKLPEHAARLAAVLALVSDPDASEIASEQMAAGIMLAQHYVAEALRLFEVNQVSDDLRLAEKLLIWLLGCWNEPFVSLPDIYQKGPNAIREKRELPHGWWQSSKTMAGSFRKGLGRILGANFDARHGRSRGRGDHERIRKIRPLCVLAAPTPARDGSTGRRKGDQ
jgi:hypothetical protein